MESCGVQPKWTKKDRMSNTNGAIATRQVIDAFVADKSVHLCVNYKESSKSFAFLLRLVEKQATKTFF